MKISQNGIRLIEHWEGCILQSYDDANERLIGPGDTVKGVLTIGIGHTSAAGLPKVVPGMRITQEEAEDILRNDLKRVEADVMSLVKVPLNQNQFDALVSFHFNTGALGKSSALKFLNKGDYETAADRLLLWNKAKQIGPGPIPGLVARREDEKALFLMPVLTQPKQEGPSMSLSFPYNIFAAFIGPDKVGGWVRSIVATGLGFLAAKLSTVPFFSEILSPEVIASIAAAASALVVGLWSQLTKSEAQAGNLPSTTVTPKVLDHSRKD